MRAHLCTSTSPAARALHTREGARYSRVRERANRLTRTSAPLCLHTSFLEKTRLAEGRTVVLRTPPRRAGELLRTSLRSMTFGRPAQPPVRAGPQHTGGCLRGPEGTTLHQRRGSQRTAAHQTHRRSHPHHTSVVCKHPRSVANSLRSLAKPPTPSASEQPKKKKAPLDGSDCRVSRFALGSRGPGPVTVATSSGWRSHPERALRGRPASTTYRTLRVQSGTSVLQSGRPLPRAFVTQ